VAAVKLVLNSRLVGVLVMVASLIALVVSAYSGEKARDFARCQATYNEINNERLRALTEISADERAAERRRDDALDDVLGDPSVLRPAGERTAEDRQRMQRLFAEYLDARLKLRAERVRADAARRANPVPPPPSAVCS
jgi:hypothetical protein